MDWIVETGRTTQIRAHLIDQAQRFTGEDVPTYELQKGGRKLPAITAEVPLYRTGLARIFRGKWGGDREVLQMTEYPDGRMRVLASARMVKQIKRTFGMK